MFKFVIKNKANIITHEGSAKDQETLDKIVLENSGNSWGKPLRTAIDLPFNPLSDFEKLMASSHKTVSIAAEVPAWEDEFGVQHEAIPERFAEEYTWDAEYSIKVEDITVAHDAEQLAIKLDKEQRDLDNKDVKEMLTWIKDHPTMETKLKKILKVLIKETLK